MASLPYSIYSYFHDFAFVFYDKYVSKLQIWKTQQGKSATYVDVSLTGFTKEAWCL